MMKNYVKTVSVCYCVCLLDFQAKSFSASSIYIGARDEARDLALALARACSLTSARS